MATATATVVLVGLSLSIMTRTQCVQAADEAANDNSGQIYQFKYHVHDLMTMDYKTHEEIGENGSVRGTYTVREPNGDLRVVSYTAGDSGGFQAMVRVGSTSTASEEPQGTKPIGARNAQTKISDSPLKIQLDTGRGMDQPQHREQRQSISEEYKMNSTLVPTAAAQETVVLKENPSENTTTPLAQSTNFEKQAKYAISSTLSDQNIKMKTADQSKYKPYAIPKTKWPASYYKLKELQEKSVKMVKPTNVPMTIKIKPRPSSDAVKDPHNAGKLVINPELAASYLPYHLSNVQNVRHFGHLIAPVFLHVLPTQSPNRATPTVNTPVVHCST